MARFTDKTFLLVGASSGIGNAVLSTLVDEGAQVYVWGRNEPGLDSSRVVFSSVDVTEDLSSQSPQMPDRLDGVVYSPGSINLGAFRQLKPETYLSDFNLNLVGAVRVLQAVQQVLASDDGASVVFFSTVAARIGMQFHASVASVKAALHGLAISLAAEYASKGVRFNVIAPSLTDTPLASRLLGNDKKREAAAGRHPLGRVGDPGDIARAALFLLDPANSWITGQILGVDGGLSGISGL